VKVKKAKCGRKKKKLMEAIIYICNSKSPLENPQSQIPARHRLPEADSGEAGGPNPKFS